MFPVATFEWLDVTTSGLVHVPYAIRESCKLILKKFAVWGGARTRGYTWCSEHVYVLIIITNYLWVMNKKKLVHLSCPTTQLHTTIWIKKHFYFCSVVGSEERRKTQQCIKQYVLCRFLCFGNFVLLMHTNWNVEAVFCPWLDVFSQFFIFNISELIINSKYEQYVIRELKKNNLRMKMHRGRNVEDRRTNCSRKNPPPHRRYMNNRKDPDWLETWAHPPGPQET